MSAPMIPCSCCCCNEIQDGMACMHATKFALKFLWQCALSDQWTADSTASERSSRCFDLRLVKGTGGEAKRERRDLGGGGQKTEKLLF